MTTDWSLVRRSADRDALDRLLSRYWTPIYAFARTHGCDAHEAADVTQGFVSEIMLGRDLLRRADRNLGSFRSYLLASLRNYMTDQRRRSSRRPRQRLALDLSSIPIDPAETDPAAAFRREWARAVLSETVERTRRACHESGQADHWQAFELRVLTPAQGGPAVPVAVVAQSTGLDGDAVSRRVQTVKRRFVRLFREVVLETVDTADALEAECSRILADLSLAPS